MLPLCDYAGRRLHALPMFGACDGSLHSHEWPKPYMLCHVQRLVNQLPEQLLLEDPQQMGALLYSCTGVSHNDARALASALPCVPLQVCLHLIPGIDTSQVITSACLQMAVQHMYKRKLAQCRLHLLHKS